jgi:Mg2+-importing ATPase
VDPRLRTFWAEDADQLLEVLGTDPRGLTAAEAARRLAVHGPNRLMPRRRTGVLRELVRQFKEPIVLILLVATVLSLLLGDRADALIILGIVLLSGLLGFWQEHIASVTVAKLLERVQIRVDVRRGGTVVSVPPEEVVPGDVLVLSAGDVIPCDSRVLTAEALQLDESALTGETYPRHKRIGACAADASLAEQHSALFQGSHVVSGQGEAIAVVTGQATKLGEMSQALAGATPRTSFEQGTAHFGLLLARVTAILTAVILLVNLVLDRPIIDAVLFSLALAVGVTPQMLPAIVAVSLSTGARRMARAQVIVRRLDAIEDLGSMDVLCTDKTGTLTQGAITLDVALGITGEPSEMVAERAAANAQLQTGFANPLDDAILARHRPAQGWQAVDEVPFDFDRKRLSVLADAPAGTEHGARRVLVTKGAYASVLGVCSRVATPGGERPVEEEREALDQRFRQLSAGGHRVLAVAQRPFPDRAQVTVADESAMTFLGFLAFEDPPKVGLEKTIADLDALGIRLCILTGDNQLAARHVAEEIRITGSRVVTGALVDRLDDAQLAREVATANVFAELTPSHKERIIEALRASGSVVGYLGDGINDAAPLHIADVGISVDTAVDVAKSAAAMVLLDKNLDVIVEAVRLGRQTFANTLKYVYTTISANFGNTASMAAASAFLTFLPLLPRQILLLNFLSDLPSVTIAGDRVDREDVERPRRWDLHQVRDFMVVFGLLSTAFDLLTFAVLLQVFDADAELFRTGWFVGSALTELAVLFVLRTRRVAFRSRPGRALQVTSVAVALLTTALPFMSVVASALGLTRPPAVLVMTLVAITCAYVMAAEVTKRVFYGGARTPRPARTVPSVPRPSVARPSVARPSVPDAATAKAALHHRRLERVAHEHGRAPHLPPRTLIPRRHA